MKEALQNPEGNYYDKYASKNPIERKLMTGFFAAVKETLEQAVAVDSIATLHEAGCGEGHFSSFLAACFKTAELSVSDVSENCIEQAKKTLEGLPVSFSVRNIYELSKEGRSFDLVAASEVLEHVEDPARALKELEAATKKYVLVTIPNEPLWRILNMCRFKYLMRLGNTPGHINHWNRRSFISFVNKNTKLKVAAANKSLPWLIFVLRKDVV